MEILDPNEKLKTVVADYLKLDRPPYYALLLTGPWGIGKTYLIKKLVKDVLGSGGKYYYVSLFGLTSREDIQSAVLAAILPVLDNKAVKVGASVLKTAMKFFRIETDLDASKFVNAVQDGVFIFDDIERSKMPLAEVLGYLNEFVEHDGCRVLLVANDEEIKDDALFRKQKEKLIGRTLRVRSDAKGAVAHFLAEIQEGSGKDYLTANLPALMAVYERSEIHNLRILRQTLSDFIHFHDCLPERAFEKHEACLNLARLFFAFSFEVKSGRISRENLAERTDAYILRARMKADDEHPLAVMDRRYVGFDIWHQAVDNAFLAECLFDGFFEGDALRLSVLNHTDFTPPGEVPAWKILALAPYVEERAFDNALVHVQKDVANQAYVEPGEVMHVFASLIWCAENGLLDEEPTAFLEHALRYIDGLPNDRFVSGDMRRRFGGELRAGHGGVAFHRLATPESREQIAQRLDLKLEAAKTLSLQSEAKTLLSALQTAPDLFFEKLEGPEGRIDDPVLCHIDPDDFVSVWLSLEPDRMISVSQMLRRRILGDRSLEDEHEWLGHVGASLRDRLSALSGLPRVRGEAIGNFVESLLQ